MNSDIRNTIRGYLQRELMQDRSDMSLDDGLDLLKEHIIDSLAIFMLIAFLEEQYGITIDADELLIENFQTVASIARMVEIKLEPASARSA
jgi:acyl carrier protein